MREREFTVGLCLFVALWLAYVGLPEPAALWLGYLIPELLVPCIMVVAQLAAGRRAARAG